MTHHTMTIEPRVILFSDIHDFSIVAMALGERQFAFMQAIYERLGDVIVAHRGEILKYMGDGILCLFPAGAALDAVQCALEMRRAYTALVQEWAIIHPTVLEVGISAGEVGIGTFGHASLRVRDAFGLAMNNAARIGHHEGVAITGEIYTLIAPYYSTRPLPDRQVKWLPTPLRAWEIIETE
ncbi:MAG: adenylate/guanylate cyclase domain-containing protein [Anaerolineae bacterium]|nr:adenylate/guanylate cyclase domain-containing protein [Anaerolineae bacterium]